MVLIGCCLQHTRVRHTLVKATWYPSPASHATQARAQYSIMRSTSPTVSVTRLSQARWTWSWDIPCPQETSFGIQDGIEPPRMDALDTDCGLDSAAQENPFGSATSPTTKRSLADKMTFKRRSISSVSSLVEGLKVCDPPAYVTTGYHSCTSAWGCRCLRVAELSQSMLG